MPVNVVVPGPPIWLFVVLLVLFFVGITLVCVGFDPDGAYSRPFYPGAVMLLLALLGLLASSSWTSAANSEVTGTPSSFQVVGENHAVDIFFDHRAMSDVRLNAPHSINPSNLVGHEITFTGCTKNRGGYSCDGVK